jgi:RNA polymerase sigma-70 factor (ECF subfamily)
VRAWLYRIATNVCLDMHRSVQRRARPVDLGPSSPPDEAFLGPLHPESLWVSPIADDRVLPVNADPAEIAEARDSVRLAFVSALQHLPGRQRAALILCEVLRWQATEVAELLDSSTASINSALQRARATLASIPAGERADTIDDDNAELLAKYVQAFERYDISELVTLLHDDAIQSMPPFAMWIQGAQDIGTWMVQPGPMECEGSRLVPAVANGMPAFGQYRRDHERGGYKAWAMQVLQIRDGKIGEFTFVLDVPNVFPSFALPLRLDS